MDPHERDRLDVLRSLDILDTPPEVEYDDVAFLAAALCRTPVGAVNFVDQDRHWTKAIVGVPDGQGASLSNDVSFCAATVRRPGGTLHLGDAAATAGWSDHPLVCGGPRVRFYAGAAIVVDGQAVGVVCAFGDEPRPVDPRELEGIQVLARQAASHLLIRRRNRSLRAMATTDPLTGLPNRVLLDDRLTSALTARARSGAEVGVVFCDVDGLKAVNDLRGHAAGDRLLRRVAEHLRGAVRDVDTVARLSGDEFVVVCPGVRGEDELAAIVARLAHDELSVGGVLAQAGDDAAAVLRRADAAMYAVKAGRRPPAAAVA